MVIPCVEGKVYEDTVRREEGVWGYRAYKGMGVVIPCVEGKLCVGTEPRREWVCGYRA